MISTATNQCLAVQCCMCRQLVFVLIIVHTLYMYMYLQHSGQGIYVWLRIITCSPEAKPELSPSNGHTLGQHNRFGLDLGVVS